MVINLINGYEIKKINNKEVLYIYTDYNQEFANTLFKNKNSVKKSIKKYIKKNKINFKGVLVAIVVGGAVIGTVTLNKPKKGNIIQNKDNIVAILNDSKIFDELDIQNEVINEEGDKKELESSLDQEQSNETIHDTTQNNIEKNNNINKNVYNNSNNSNINKSVSNNSNNSNINNSISREEVKVEVKEEKEVTNDIYVTVYRTNGTILNLELEEYIVGVVGAEMPASFNKEALKAQAVVARTYTLKTINSNKKLTDNNSTQNYKSNEELRNLWGSSYNTYYNKVQSAVNETKGEYLVYNGNYIDAVYHSTSNGHTEDSVYVWGNSIPYLKSVNSIYDSTNKNYSSTIFLSYQELSNKLKTNIDNNTDLSNINRNNSGRVDNITINNRVYSGVEIRTLLSLRSTDFEFEKLDSGVNITTKGYGHGVGMSQYGANGMANNGSNYKDILLHYYSGVTIKSLS